MLHCGCTVYVACHPETGTAHTRVIERRGTTCRVRTHDVGSRLYLWEILPPPVDEPMIDAFGERPAILAFRREQTGRR